MMGYKRQQNAFRVGDRKSQYVFDSEALDSLIATTPTPLQQLLGAEFRTNLFTAFQSYNGKTGQEINVQLGQVTSLLDAGYNGKEIAEMLGISPQLVSFYKKKIKEIARWI